MKPKYLMIIAVVILIVLAGFAALGFYETSPSQEDFTLTIDPSNVSANGS